jgi:thiol:disulfide interchange protein/DsbC/DsbD-like thiol-disulfide interchange protein
MRLPVFLVYVLLCASPLQADVVRSANTEAELVSEVRTIQPGQPFWAALRLKPDRHWHTYWKNPGDSGLEPSIDWKLPEGFQAGSIEWPYPARLDLPPLAVYAYEREVFLLTKITPPDAIAEGSKVELKANARWLACEVNCIPGEADLSLPLTVSSDPVYSNWAKEFAAVRFSLPLKESPWKITARADKDFILIEAVPSGETGYEHSGLEFFPYSGDVIAHAEKQRFRTEDGIAQLLVKRSTLQPGDLSSVEGLLVSGEGWRGKGSEKALEINAIPQQVEHVPVFAEAALPAADDTKVPLVFAFLGGLILNLMPCVFPVLSLKILGFVEHAKESGYKAWHQGAFFAAGVVLSFWVLAGILILFRSTGQAVGWGYQLQSPVFVAGLIVLFYLLGLNLLGLFEIGLSATRAGSAAKRNSGLRAAFGNGVLATLVATPCTAPFMGTALGYALTRPPAVSFAVFTALGLGMAFPYLLLSVFPAAVRRLPRPGPWMNTLKKFLSLFLFATVAWLAWVFSLQTQPAALILLSVGLLLVLTAARIYGQRYQRSQDNAVRLRFLRHAAVLFAAGLAASLFAGTLNETGDGRVRGGNSGSQLEWIDYSVETIEKLRQEGRPVFLDFTAAWCLTCHVNERVALQAPGVKKRFEELNVALVKADWTNRNEEITRALASFGRTSIPFYVLYPPGGGPPEALPEILTPGIVLDALENMEKSK